MIQQSISPEQGTAVARTTVTRILATSSRPAVKSRKGWFAFFMALLKEAIRVRVAPATATTGRIQRKRGRKPGLVKAEF